MTTARLPLQDVLETVAAARVGTGAPRDLAVVELTMRPGEATPLHVQDADEAIRVLEGRIVVHTEAGIVELEPGDEYVIAGGVPHAISAGTDARYLATSYVRSAQRYQDFLRAVAVPDAAPGEPHMIEEERTLALLAEANEITVLGPPGTLAARVAA